MITSGMWKWVGAVLVILLALTFALHHFAPSPPEVAPGPTTSATPSTTQPTGKPKPHSTAKPSVTPTTTKR